MNPRKSLTDPRNWPSADEVFAKHSARVAAGYKAAERRLGNDTRSRVEQPQSRKEDTMSKSVKNAKATATVKPAVKIGATLRFYCGKCAAGVDVKVKSVDKTEKGKYRAHGHCPSCKTSIGRGL